MSKNARAPSCWLDNVPPPSDADCDRDQVAEPAERRVKGGKAARAKKAEGGEKQARQIIKLVLDQGVKPIRHRGDPFLQVARCSGFDVFDIPSAALNEWITVLSVDKLDVAPSAQVLTEVSGYLRALAMHPDRGSESPVFLRVGHNDDANYLDLTNDQRELVRVTPDGWEVVTDGPLFRRSRYMGALPTPVRGGTLDELKSLINVLEPDWPLAVAWLIASLWPEGPYPILLLEGEQGSAKSTTLRVLRSTIDPRKVALRALPQDERTLGIACHNTHVIAPDNVSRLEDWLSDAFCRVATGAGIEGRALYTNHDEVVIEACNPIALNGIGDLGARPDFLDRTVTLRMPVIPKARRRTERVQRALEAASRGRILGALLDVYARTMQELPSVRLVEAPRMADFAHLGVAVARALGMPDTAFLSAYERVIADAVETALDGSPIAQAVISMADEGEWSLTPTELLEAIAKRVGETSKRELPRGAAALGKMLKRLAPALRRAGVDVATDRTKARRTTAIRRCKPGGDGTDDGTSGVSSSPDTSCEFRAMPAVTGVTASSERSGSVT